MSTEFESKNIDITRETSFPQRIKSWLHREPQKKIPAPEPGYQETSVDRWLDRLRRRIPSAPVTAVTIGTAVVAVEITRPAVVEAAPRIHDESGQRTTAESGEERWQYFPETKHAIQNEFYDFWHKNGGLSVFGFPLTEEMDMKNLDGSGTFKTQYLERQRFEYHPENAGTPYEVLLGRMGADMLEKQGRPWTPGNDTPDKSMYFEASGYAVAPEFQDYWKSHGLDLGDAGVSERESMGLFGMPITKAQVETNSSGDTVLTQWFERARLEAHPDGIKQGRLGAELYEKLQQERPKNGQELLTQTDIVDNASATVNGKTYTVESRIVRGSAYKADIQEEFKGYLAGVAADECQKKGCNNVEVIILDDAGSFEDAKLKFPSSVTQVSRVDVWSEQKQAGFPAYYVSRGMENDKNVYVYISPVSGLDPNNPDYYRLNPGITREFFTALRPDGKALTQDFDSINKGAFTLTK